MASKLRDTGSRQGAATTQRVLPFHGRGGEGGGAAACSDVCANRLSHDDAVIDELASYEVGRLASAEGLVSRKERGPSQGGLNRKVVAPSRCARLWQGAALPCEAVADASLVRQGPLEPEPDSPRLLL